MITAQDIREKTFEKAKIGGYDMAEVDDFLEQLADDLTSSQKETAVLRGKMKVLVDKIEEYRSNEAALNQSLIAAQKLAIQIESEARDKADKLLADANAQVAETLGNITEKREFEEKRLAAAEAASAKFIDGIRAMCNAQLRNLDSLSLSTLAEKPAAAPAPVKVAEPEAVEEVEAEVEVEAEPDDSASIDSTQPFSL